jgi:hypothetical protein
VDLTKRKNFIKVSLTILPINFFEILTLNIFIAKKEAKTSPYIGRYEVLPQFTNPPAAKAMKLLKRISTDPGILAIMKKYNWHVGTLKEMPPEGLVGVSEVCVLGYNQNMGQAIALRLRTDNLKGFRYYNVVMETSKYHFVKLMVLVVELMVL